MLTRKTRDLLKFIAAYSAREGMTPTYDEMKDGLGLKSKSGIHRLLHRLQDRGYLLVLPHRARAVQILRVAPAIGTACPVCGHQHIAEAA